MVREAFADLLGQETAVDLLCAAIAQQRIAPAYLFVGTPGIGRRLAALRFAECLLTSTASHAAIRRRIENHNHPDLLWVEPTYLQQGKLMTLSEAEAAGVQRKSPPLIRLEQVREISRFLSRPTLESPRAVVLMEGAETMPEAAANGLLKTLEEPGQATLILLATESAKLLATIVSRCQTIPFRRLSQELTANILEQAGYAEILQQPDILAMAQGSPGQAIAAWQRLQMIPADLLTELTQLPQNLRQALSLAKRISRELDTESQLWLVEYLQHSFWQTQRSPTILTTLETAQTQLRRFVQPRLVWEVTLMGLVAR